MGSYCATSDEASIHSGIETVKEIRKTDPDIPIIALTLAEEEGLIRQARDAGMNDYLPKPANLNKIRKILVDNFPE